MASVYTYTRRVGGCMCACSLYLALAIMCTKQSWQFESKWRETRGKHEEMLGPRETMKELEDGMRPGDVRQRTASFTMK